MNMEENGHGSPDNSNSGSNQNLNFNLIQQMLMALTNLQIQSQSQSTNKEPRVPDVPVFNGNKNAYSTFLARLQNFFSLQPKTYDSDEKKIGYVISRLEGTAADWAVTILENSSMESNLLILKDWNRFLRAFEKFKDPFLRRNATDQLLSLKQGNQSVLNYWTKFSELLYRSDIQPESARPIFERGLKFSLREKMVTETLPQELDDFVMAVIDLDEKIWRLYQEKKSFGKTQVGSDTFSNARNFNRNTPISGPVPMEIGRIDTEGNDLNSKERLNELFRMEKSESRRICILENRCHYCKCVVGNPPSHVAETCPRLLKKKDVAIYSCLLSHEVPLPQKSKSVSSSLKIPVKCKAHNGQFTLSALIDSGAMGMGFIHDKIAQKYNLSQVELAKPLKVRSVDGEPCGKGTITHKVSLEVVINGYQELLEFLIIQSPGNELILGLEWLKKHNPEIDWSNETIIIKEQSKLDETPEEAVEGVSQRQVHNYDNTTIDISAVMVTAEDFLEELDFYYVCQIVEESPSDIGSIPDCIREFSSVFSKSELPNLPPRRPGVDMPIDLLPGEFPPCGPIYALSKEEEIELQRYITAALDKGIISPSKSPVSAPVLFVKKANGKLRLCVDYRGLNKVIQTNVAPLPILKEVLRKVKGCQIFSKIDLVSAFNNIRIREGDEWLTAFRTKYGLFEYKVVPFGQKNAPAAFQGFMNQIFVDMLDRGIICYIDDLLVYAATREEHDILLKEVFRRLSESQLVVNPSKCEFGQPSVTYLGHVISAEGVSMAPGKVKDVLQWEIPKNLKALQSFLGLTNFYRDFIPNYSEIVCPLTDLTRKNTEFLMGLRELEAFNLLKSSFSSDVILLQPEPNEQFYVECDASDFAMGSVVSQKDKRTGRLRPIGFFSKKFSPQEINYDVFDKELSAIIKTFEEYRYLLIGTKEPVIVYSDHNNLKYFSTTKNLNRRQARWSQYLEDFNFVIVHRPGKLQVVADPLSRQDKYQLQPEAPERLINQKVLLPQDKFINALITPHRNSDSEENASNSDYDINDYNSQENLESDDGETNDVDDMFQFMEIQEGPSNKNTDPFWFQYLLQYLWHGELPLVLSIDLIKKIKNAAKSFLFKDDRLFKRLVRNGHMHHALYVPFSERESLIKKYHLTLGHMQVSTLLPLIQVRFYWPYMDKDLKNLQEQCPQCQLNLNPLIPSLRPLHPHDPVGLPFVKWGIDFIQDLPETSEGYKNIFSARCYSTKRVIFIKTKDRTAATAAKCIYEGIVCKFGVPWEIVSDRATAFLDTVLQEYLKLMEIHHLPTSAYTPRSNGLVERVHRDLKNILRKLCDGDLIKWDHFLPQAEFILNIRINESTGYSPFYLCHGVEAHIPGDQVPPVPPGYYDINDEGDVAFISARELEILGQNRAAALMRLKTQAARMKDRYDAKVGVTEPSYQVGDVVKLKNQSQTKLQFPYKGPFYIVDQGPNQTYYIQRPDGRRFTDQSGRDIPINPDHLAFYTAVDPEFYSESDKDDS